MLLAFGAAHLRSPGLPPSPPPSAAGRGQDVLNEFKQLVKECHKRGIEVILDVVFNHTAEGNEKGPTLSFRQARAPARRRLRPGDLLRLPVLGGDPGAGCWTALCVLLSSAWRISPHTTPALPPLPPTRRGLDNRVYYMLAPGGQCYNYSGCGNTFNCNHPVARQFIVDCLRYWVEEMHVDGFRWGRVRWHAARPRCPRPNSACGRPASRRCTWGAPCLHAVFMEAHAPNRAAPALPPPHVAAPQV